MSDPNKMPPDLWAEAMKAAIPRYSGEKSMLDPDKNPLDSLIEPTDENDSDQGNSDEDDPEKSP